MSGRRVLIMACSATKDPAPGGLPAYLRYQGSGWKTYRATLRTIAPALWPETIILSAEFGLIRDCREILNYDRRLDVARAAELATSMAQIVALDFYLAGAGDVHLFGG